MAKRLHKTTADYLAIAVSPALIMALVGSLVYFLIAVMYVGEYHARLNYSFGLFVFAAVLIARIAIEMGSEHAVLYALALGVAMFLFLVRFVEQPSSFGHLINLALMLLVWWCAHRLTWDSTVIDEDEDASGEGLMQKIGVDDAAADGSRDNELIASPEAPTSRIGWFWNNVVMPRHGPHTPGLWVLYFSLAALPLFGIGQHWIPTADAGRRRYAFSLLLVYVAAALSLLVTTSFLNLRRYLRQRRVEMPPLISGTWVGVGAALIVVVMAIAALIPRPAAEIALSRVPWQAGSPGGLSASRMAMNRDGGEEQKGQQDATAGEKAADPSQANQQQASGGQANQQNPQSGSQGQQNPSSGAQSQSGGQQSGGQQSGGQQSGGQQSGGQQSGGQQSGGQQSGGQQSGGQQSGGQQSGGQQSGPQQGNSASQNNTNGNADANQQLQQPDQNGQSGEQNANSQQDEQSGGGQTSSAFQRFHPAAIVQTAASAFGSLASILKMLFYLVLLLAVAYGVWRFRRQILQALRDIWQQLLALFGGSESQRGKSGAEESAKPARRRTFSEFQDPFLTGRSGKMSPAELVCYTFEAFEAWAGDRGRPRELDCTPHELVQLNVPQDTPMFAEARRLTRLYGEAAYAPSEVSRSAANDLRQLWEHMRNSIAQSANEASVPVAT